MDILLDNLNWMAFNVFLACLGILFGFLFLYFKDFFLKVLFLTLWVIFIPNTIYLVTDLMHLPKQLIKLDFLNQVILLMQYIFIFFLGIVTFLLGLYPIDKTLGKLKNKKLTMLSLVFVNFLIAFGVVLGRFERVSSWFVFIQPQEVIKSSLRIFQSPTLLISTLITGVFINLIYFIWRSRGCKILKSKG